jgi:lysophospholipase L1-like esterase
MTRKLLTNILIFMLLITGYAQETQIPVKPNQKAITNGMNVLVIGDSNTEIGFITGELARIFETKYGYFGSGYHSLNASIGMGSGYLPYLKIENVGWWQKPAMVQPGAPKPYMAPDGSYVWSNVAGSHTDVKFWGNTIDIYWLADPQGGDMTATVDAGMPQIISTKTEKRSIQRTTLKGFEDGWHTLVITVKSQTITLTGVDAKINTPGSTIRAVVNKWGKGWATTADYLDVDPIIFADSIKSLQPDVTVILLGTNDHNLKGFNRDEYAANLAKIIERVKKAVPATRILVVSTGSVNSGWSNLGLAHYLKILPELCKLNGATYWDMSTWFGVWAKNNTDGLMQDAVHVNQKGGEKIAGQLYDEILKVAKDKPADAIPAIAGHEKGIAPAKSKVDGLLAWWSADNQVVVDDDGKVIKLIDSSDNKADAVAQWDWSRPKYIENAVNGKPVINFDGKTSYLTVPMLNNARSIMIAFRSNKLILGHSYFNSRPFHIGVVRPQKAFSMNYASKAVTGGKGYLNGQEIYIPDDKDDALEFDPKKMQIFSLVMTDNVPFNVLGWGGSWNFDNYMTGDVAEMMVFNKPLTDKERKDIEKELAKRWEIILTTPAQ